MISVTEPCYLWWQVIASVLMLTREISDNKTLTIKSNYPTEYQTSSERMIQHTYFSFEESHVSIGVCAKKTATTNKKSLCDSFIIFFRCSWFLARVAGIPGGGFRPQLHLQLFIHQSWRRERCRQCGKFTLGDPRWPRGPWRCKQRKWREDKQTHRVPFHEVHANDPTVKSSAITASTGVMTCLWSPSFCTLRMYRIHVLV